MPIDNIEKNRKERYRELAAKRRKKRLRQLTFMRERELMASWLSETELSLRNEFTEARITRLIATKPSRLEDLARIRRVLYDIRKFRHFAREIRDCSSLFPGTKPKKGWATYFTNVFYLASTSRIVKIDLLIEDLEERIVHLEDSERQAVEALKRSMEAAEQFALVGQDQGLAGALWHALDFMVPTVGFVYLKRWTMPDGNCWFKLGITNNLDRREAEQNVLPVPAETIACVDVGSMDRARSIEAVIHQVLEKHRITDAQNRELFRLGDQQASAVKVVLERLK